MYGYIYVTTNLINNKKYIGQHKFDRFDESYYGSGKGINAAIKKYGIENFKCEILPSDGIMPTVCGSFEELNESEKYYIELYNCVNSKEYYNMIAGGTNTMPTAQGIVALSNKAKLKFQNNINRISKQEFYDYYITHNTDDIKNHFQLSSTDYKKLKDYYEIPPKTQGQINEIIKNRFLEKYGVENPFQLEDIKNKSKQTKLERYGDENYSNRNQYKQTCIEKFGSESPFGNKNVREKSKETIINRFGSEQEYRQYQKNASMSTLANKHGSIHEAYLKIGKKSSDTAHKRTTKSPKQQGKKWYNNGVVETLATECPEGFVHGRLKFNRTSINNVER